MDSSSLADCSAADWSCPRCTLVNAANVPLCNACQLPRNVPLAVPAPDNFELTIKVAAGGSLSLTVNPLDYVATLKTRIESKEGIPASQQRLIFAGRLLTDQSSLGDNNISKNCTLYLVRSDAVVQMSAAEASASYGACPTPERSSKTKRVAEKLARAVECSFGSTSKSIQWVGTKLAAKIRKHPRMALITLATGIIVLCIIIF